MIKKSEQLQSQSMNEDKVGTFAQYRIFFSLYKWHICKSRLSETIGSARIPFCLFVFSFFNNLSSILYFHLLIMEPQTDTDYSHLSLRCFVQNLHAQPAVMLSTSQGLLKSCITLFWHHTCWMACCSRRAHCLHGLFSSCIQSSWTKGKVCVVTWTTSHNIFFSHLCQSLSGSKSGMGLCNKAFGDSRGVLIHLHQQDLAYRALQMPQGTAIILRLASSAGFRWGWCGNEKLDSERFPCTAPGREKSAGPSWDKWLCAGFISRALYVVNVVIK